MSFNRLKYEYFFPSKVFRCACLGQIIENCCDNGQKETYCVGCIKHYLKLMYNYLYYVNFDLKCS